MVDLPEDASDFDAGVVRGGLRADEREWFEQRRRDLEANRGAGNAPDPEDLVAGHEVQVAPARWSKFGEWLGPFETTHGLIRLTRGDVAAIAAECRETGCWLPLLVVSYMWGWGKKAYGPRRLSWVLDGKWGRPAPAVDEIQRRLAVAVCVLDRESAWCAYDLLLEEGQIPHFGPAFLTKFLYFAGKPMDVPSPAMVLDKRLANRMRWFWARRSHEPYAANAQPPKWLWQGPRWSTYRYRIYLALLNRAAEQLSQSGRRWTPDLVEWILFAGDPAKALGEA